MTNDALRISNLSCDLTTRGSPRSILSDVSLKIEQGEAVGLIGESGSGKTMTTRAVTRMLPPNVIMSGEIRVKDEDISNLNSSRLRRLRSHTVATIYQDPWANLNPTYPVGRFLTEGLRMSTGLSQREAVRSACEMLESVGITEPSRRMRHYPHELSGGQLQRVVIAAAMLQTPDLILADEPTTALDVTTQAEIVRLLDKLRRERGMGLLFVTHDLALAASVCDRIYVMYAGAILEEVPARDLNRVARHPYTRALIDARPSASVRVEHLPAIPGRPLAAYEVPRGCRFSDRCAYVEPECRVSEPLMREVDLSINRCRRSEELWGGS